MPGNGPFVAFVGSILCFKEQAPWLPSLRWLCTLAANGAAAWVIRFIPSHLHCNPYCAPFAASRTVLCACYMPTHTWRLQLLICYSSRDPPWCMAVRKKIKITWSNMVQHKPECA